MASPQLENGYTKIANEIMEALAKHRLPGEQRQVLDVIFRKTYGFNKKDDMISNSQFVEATGLKKGNVSRAIKSLIEKKVVIKSDNTVIKSDNRSYSTYRFNKDYSEWKLLSKKQPVIKKATAVIKSDNKVLSKVMDTKEKKETNTKEIVEKNSQAASIYSFYISEINPLRKTRSRAITNIQKWLKKYSHDELIECIKNYKTTCSSSEPKYKKDPANFFGMNEVYHFDYLPENFDKPKNDKCKTPVWL